MATKLKNISRNRLTKIIIFTLSVLMLWLAVNVACLVVVVTFTFSGAVKLNDPLGTAYKLQDYAQAFGLQALMVIKKERHQETGQDSSSDSRRLCLNLWMKKR